MSEQSYPAWICDECGYAYGEATSREVTHHMPDKNDPKDRCGWCGRNDVPIVSPQAFDNPDFIQE